MVLCTDKTGTLTQDQIALARLADVFGHLPEEVPRTRDNVVESAVT